MQAGFLLSFILLGILIVLSVLISIYIKKKFSKKSNTPNELINEILNKMQIDKDIRFLDLGAGDFRLVFAARSVTGAESVGIEISPLLTFMAKVVKIKRFGIDKYPEIRIENFLRSDISGFNILYANVDDELVPGLVSNIKRCYDKDVILFTLNTKIPNSEPKKEYILDEKNTLYKYSIS